MNLSTYAKNKIYTFLLLVFIYFLSSILETFGHSKVNFMIKCYVLLGLGHFLLGFQFMHRSFQLERVSVKFQWTFWVCLLLSSIALYFCFYPFIVAIFIHYILVGHGHLNEKTMFLNSNKKEKGYTILGNPLLFMLYLVHLFNTSYVNDYTFNVKATKVFSLFSYYFTTYSVDYMMYAIVVTSVIILTKKIFEKKYKDIFVHFIIHGVGQLFLFLVGRVDYLTLSTLIISYHFISWNIYSFQMAQRSQNVGKIKKLKINGIYMHLLIALIIFSESLIPSKGVQSAVLLIQGPIFLIITIGHIISSLYNEKNIKPWLLGKFT